MQYDSINLFQHLPSHFYSNTETLEWTDLLQAAGTPAGDAAERPDETDDLPVHVVFDCHVKAAQRATTVPGAAVILLFGIVDLLTQTVFYFILSVFLKTGECWAWLGEEKGKQ